MAEDDTYDPQDPYLTTAQAARRLKVKPGTLDKWCWQGKGPAYRDHGIIVYHVDDLDAWSETRRRTRTKGETRNKTASSDASAPSDQAR